MLNSERVVSAARTYLDVPFHHQGRVRAGVDCAGLLILVAQDLGLSPIDLKIYDHNPDHAVLRQYLDAQPFFVSVQIKDREVGDIVLIALNESRRGHHLGILTDIGIIHAFAPAHKVVETALADEMARQIVAVYRWQS